METSPQNPQPTSADEPVNEVDTFWIVANIFAIIHILEDKFGYEAIERLVAAATAIEASMREEAQKES